MYFNFYYLFFFLRKYIKQKNMRLLLTFVIFILGGFYTFGKENCCEQCCEYLKNCCKKGKGEVKNENNVEEEEEVPEEFYLRKTEQDDSEKIKKLVNTNWYTYKGKNALFFLYEKINSAVNQNLNENDVIKVKKEKNGFSIEGNFIPEKDNNEQKWVLFEIIYKEKKEEGEGEENKENEEETKYLYCSDIESFANFGIFESCKQYISISVIDCNTSKVTNMSSMFYGCSSLQQLDFKNFNTETVTRMSYIFQGCSSLTELDLSKFDTKNVTNISAMFDKCSSLHTVTFNNNLNEGIKQQLENLGFTEKIKEKGNKITLKKNN